MNEEPDQQNSPRAEKRRHHPRIEPIQAIALIQTGIDQRHAEAGEQKTEHIRRRPAGFHYIFGDAKAETQSHDDGEGDVLPEDPTPGKSLDIPAPQARPRC